jgi:hypothetical protein
MHVVLLLLLLALAARPGLARAGRHHHPQEQAPAQHAQQATSAAPVAAAAAGNWPQDPDGGSIGYGAGSQQWSAGDNTTPQEASEAAIMQPHIGRLMLEATTDGGGNDLGMSGATSTAGSVAPVAAADAGAAAAAALGTPAAVVTTELTADEIYQKRLHSRILLLISDAWWLVYTIGLFAKAILGLFVPLVQIGRTGSVILDATFLLNAGQLLAEFVARLGDVMSKVFLTVSHAVAPI